MRGASCGHVASNQKSEQENSSLDHKHRNGPRPKGSQTRSFMYLKTKRPNGGCESVEGCTRMLVQHLSQFELLY